jgi:hypothetical protein
LIFGETYLWGCGSNQLHLKIREHHPENVFSSMETIMTLVIEESEDISFDLLSPLLDSIKKDNKVGV